MNPRALVSLIAVALVPSLFAEPAPKSASKVEKRPEPAWSVRVEVLMVTMPQDKALALLPDLHDPAKSDNVAKHVVSMIEKKEATLVGYPMIQLLDGQRSVIETIEEKRYPVSFDPPTPAAEKPAVDAASSSSDGLPSSFETRNVGVTLEVEPRVLANGNWIELQIVPQRVAFVGMEVFSTSNPKGGTIKLEQPKFVTSKVTTNIRLRNGQAELLAPHTLRSAEGQTVELHLVRATATPLP